ncbi:MAG: hypothetical protein EBY61_02490 [Actinobacteria bacterium]|nr:hypothetical protein [Actinomycetota bacterium]
MGLPRPTTDLDQLKADLDEHGYCIVADALTPNEVSALRNRITEQATAERARALDYHYQAEAEGDDVNQWVYQLINKGEEFQNLALHPTARALATHILGAEHILSSLDAHITHPGNETMPLHADQWWMPQPVAPGTPHGRQGDMTRETGPFGEPTRATVPINPPLVANMMWMANDFTVANGATRIVPGSHLSGCLPDPERTADHSLTWQSHLRHAHRGARVDESGTCDAVWFHPVVELRHDRPPVGHGRIAGRRNRRAAVLALLHAHREGGGAGKSHRNLLRRRAAQAAPGRAIRRCGK